MTIVAVLNAATQPLVVDLTELEWLESVWKSYEVSFHRLEYFFARLLAHLHVRKQLKAIRVAYLQIAQTLNPESAADYRARLGDSAAGCQEFRDSLTSVTRPSSLTRRDDWSGSQSPARCRRRRSMSSRAGDAQQDRSSASDDAPTEPGRPPHRRRRRRRRRH